nr:MAG: c-type cytochrome [Hyphomicrobiales bacterium]
MCAVQRRALSMKWMRPLIVCATLGAAASPSVAAQAGEELFLACSACHSAAEDALGPNLQGIIGRASAARDDFRYSPAMQRAGIVWTEENLRSFLLDPQGFIRGNRMPFSGFSNPADADAIIAYLKSLQ